MVASLREYDIMRHMCVRTAGKGSGDTMYQKTLCGQLIQGIVPRPPVIMMNTFMASTISFWRGV